MANIPYETLKAELREMRETPTEQRARYNYGITRSIYNLLLLRQSGVCAICKRAPDDGKRLVVDHDHPTGIVRGLLCGTCNTGLGLLGDTEERLTAAAVYLARANRAMKLHSETS